MKSAKHDSSRRKSKTIRSRIKADRYSQKFEGRMLTDDPRVGPGLEMSICRTPEGNRLDVGFFDLGEETRVDISQIEEGISTLCISPEEALVMARELTKAALSTLAVDRLVQ